MADSLRYEPCLVFGNKQVDGYQRPLGPVHGSLISSIAKLSLTPPTDMATPPTDMRLRQILPTWQRHSLPFSVYCVLLLRSLPLFTINAMYVLGYIPIVAGCVLSTKTTFQPWRHQVPQQRGHPCNDYVAQWPRCGWCIRYTRSRSLGNSV